MTRNNLGCIQALSSSSSSLCLHVGLDLTVVTDSRDFNTYLNIHSHCFSVGGSECKVTSAKTAKAFR